MRVNDIVVYILCMEWRTSLAVLVMPLHTERLNDDIVMQSTSLSPMAKSFKAHQ